MSALLLDILKNKTQADEVHVRMDQVQDVLGEELTNELCYKSNDMREAPKTQGSVIKRVKQVRAYRLGLFDRTELVDALTEVLEPTPNGITDDEND